MKSGDKCYKRFFEAAGERVLSLHININNDQKQFLEGILSSINFYSVCAFTTHPHWSSVCCAAVPCWWHWSPLHPSGTKQGHAPSLLTCSPTSQQLPKLLLGNVLMLKRWATHCNALFSWHQNARHLAQERGWRAFVLFLLVSVLLTSCTGHWQNKSPHHICTFPRQRDGTIYGKQILKCTR